MRTLLVVFTFVGTCAIPSVTHSAEAGCGGGGTSASTSGTGIVVGAASATCGGSTEATSQTEATQQIEGEWHEDPVCAAGGAVTCEEREYCEDGTPMTYVFFVANDGTEYPGNYACPVETQPSEVTGAAVLAALRRVPLPPSDLIVQPPNGRTLVNFDTNFYTEATPLDRTLRLLGQRVDLRIWPSSYEWHFGDGEAIATESAGAPYPDLEITHSYTTKGQVGPAVDTTYAAEVRVNAGPWRPVPGTVTISGDTVALEVVEATPTLVGYR
jgi:hypothetical protein